MVDVNFVFKAAEIGLTVASSMGAKELVKEAVKKCTPENLSAAKKVCVAVTKGAMTGVVTGACHAHIKGQLKKIRKCTDKVMTEFNMNPEIKTEEPVEIVETDVDLDAEAKELLS